MPSSVAGSSVTGSSDNSLDFELAFQNEEDNVDESTLNIFERCWRAINIPFEAQVITLMTIPIICLVIFSSLIFASTAARRNYVADHGPLVSQLFACATSLVDERLGGTNVINSGGSPSSLESYRAICSATDILCTRLSDLAFASTDVNVKNMYSARARQQMQDNNILRYRVESLRISGIDYRAAMTDIIVLVESGLAVLSQSKVLKFESLTLLQLRQFRMVENYLALSRGAGALWIEQVRANATTLEQNIEIENINNAVSQYVTGADDIVTGYAATQWNSWLSYPPTRQWSSDLPSVVAGTSNYTGESWRTLCTAVVEKMRNLAPTVMNDLIEARELQNELRDEAIKLSVAVVTSILAAGYIIRAQIMSSRQINEEVQESKKLHKAVTKFVPKSFLKLMGCTSVTHIIAGDQTEVSVAMLFADIHDFNAMTATMSGEQLFDWLEVYFEQMSTITDNGRGFVDKFIGDAMFCVFMNATEAVESAILMQAMTDQLNGEIVCGGGTQLIQIGIGIHHAVVSAGILGDSRRHTCTLVSSDVNLASRLEGLTKFYGARIAVSASTIELCDRRTLAYRRLGSVKCKGRMNGVEICEVFQTDPLELKLFKRETMEEFHKGLDLQAANDIEAAKGVFSTLREKAIAAELRDGALDLKLTQVGPVDEMTKK
jgi:class 3 adenylate cyclase